MKDALEKVKEFCRMFSHTMREKPGLVDFETFKLRRDLMKEELEETIAAMELCDLPEIADGLADLCYVAIGTAVAYGIPLDRVFEEVHRSNIAKAQDCMECFVRNASGRTECEVCHGTNYVVRYRPDGKVLKPEGWTPPDIKGVLGL